MNIRAQRDLMPLFLEAVVNGQYVVPKFQRDFIWGTKQIIDLFDSILKGFPIGSVIMWNPGDEQFPVFDNICGVPIKTERASQYYILDGRQRLSSLISVLMKDGENSKTYFVDMNDMTVIRSTRHYNGPELLLLSDAYDSISVVDYIERIKNDPSVTPEQETKYSDNAKMVNKKLLSYEIGYITVLGGKIDDAVEIFSRLNSKGTDIAADYMIQALTYDSNSDFLFSRAISDIQLSLGKYNFSQISREVILRCIFNYTDKPFFDAKSEDIVKMKDLPTVMECVKRDLMYAVRLLHDECKVLEYKQLPYTYQVILLAMFFKYNQSVSLMQKMELKKWFYYTSYANYFTNTSLTNIRKDIALFRDYCKGMAKTPIQYSLVTLPALPKNLSLGAVRNCCITFSTINDRVVEKKSKSSIRYYTPTAFKGKREFLCSIPYSNSEQLKRLKELFAMKCLCDDSFERFFLNQTIMDAYFKGNLARFEELREKWMRREEYDQVSRVVDFLTME